MRLYWQTRASVRPDSWNLQFAVVVDEQVVGACDIGAEHFAALRQFTTGSWLGREFQGRGLGKEFRMAALTLGYEFEGRRRALRRGVADDMLGFRMGRTHWETM